MVQKCVLVAMDACLQELKRTTTIDTSELTMEQGIFHAFDKAVRSQLDPDWHRLSPKTKQVRRWNHNIMLPLLLSCVFSYDRRPQDNF